MMMMIFSSKPLCSHNIPSGLWTICLFWSNQLEILTYTHTSLLMHTWHTHACIQRQKFLSLSTAKEGEGTIILSLVGASTSSANKGLQKDNKHHVDRALVSEHDMEEEPFRCLWLAFPSLYLIMTRYDSVERKSFWYVCATIPRLLPSVVYTYMAHIDIIPTFLQGRGIADTPGDTQDACQWLKDIGFKC